MPVVAVELLRRTTSLDESIEVLAGSCDATTAVACRPVEVKAAMERESVGECGSDANARDLVTPARFVLCPFGHGFSLRVLH